VTVVLALLALLQVAGSRGAAAPTVAVARLEADGRFEVDLHADLDALLLGLSSTAPASCRLQAMEALRRGGPGAEDAAVERLVELLRRRLRVRFDGEAAAVSIGFPERRESAAGELVTLGPRARLTGAAPGGAGAFTFFASRSFRGVELRVVGAGGAESRQVLEPGAESAPVALR
jgi:hypothetical protein